jgi:hypothetical protein
MELLAKIAKSQGVPENEIARTFIDAGLAPKNGREAAKGR